MTHHSSVVVELVDALAQPVDGRYGFGPRGRVSGVVKINGTVPASGYKVWLYRAADGILIAQTWSEPISGVYAFDGLELSQTYLAVATDHAGLYKPVAAGLFAPTGDT